MKRSILQSIAASIVIVAACWNLWRFTLNVMSTGPREENSNVVFEKVWIPFFNEFVKADYRIGSVGYITARTLRGEAPTVEDEDRFVHFYYAAIPLNIVRDKLDAPFLLADFTISGTPDRLPEGFDEIYDSGAGMLLLKRRVPR